MFVLRGPLIRMLINIITYNCQLFSKQEIYTNRYNEEPSPLAKGLLSMRIIPLPIILKSCPKSIRVFKELKLTLEVAA